MAHRNSETQFQTWLLVSLWRDSLGQVPALRGPYSRGLDQGIWGTLPSIWLRLERHHNHSWQRSSWAPFHVPLLEVLQDLQADFISGKPKSQWEVTCQTWSLWSQSLSNRPSGPDSALHVMASMPFFFLSFLHLKHLLGNGFGFLEFPPSP